MFKAAAPNENLVSRRSRLQFSLASLLTAVTVFAVFFGLLKWDLRVTFWAVIIIGAVCGAVGARRIFGRNIALAAGGAIGGYAITALMALIHHLCEVIFFEGQRTFDGVGDCLRFGMAGLGNGFLVGLVCWAAAIAHRWRHRKPAGGEQTSTAPPPRDTTTPD